MFRFDLQRFALTLTASPDNISIMAGGASRVVTLTAGGIDKNWSRLPMSTLNSTKWGSGAILITNRIVLKPMTMTYSFKIDEGSPSWATLSTGSSNIRNLNIQPSSTVSPGNYTVRCTVSGTYKTNTHDDWTTEYASATITVEVNSMPE